MTVDSGLAAAWAESLSEYRSTKAGKALTVAEEMDKRNQPRQRRSDEPILAIKSAAVGCLSALTPAESHSN